MDLLRECLLIQVSARDVYDAPALGGHPGSGLVFTGQAAHDAVRMVRRRGFTGPLLADRRRYAGSARVRGTARLSPDWIADQREAGVTVPLTDSGYIGQGDTDALCSILDQSALWDDIITVLPLHAAWLGADRPQLLTHLAAYARPVALIIESPLPSATPTPSISRPRPNPRPTPPTQPTAQDTTPPAPPPALDTTPPTQPTPPATPRPSDGTPPTPSTTSGRTPPEPAARPGAGSASRTTAETGATHTAANPTHSAPDLAHAAHAPSPPGADPARAGPGAAQARPDAVQVMPGATQADPSANNRGRVVELGLPLLSAGVEALGARAYGAAWAAVGVREVLRNLYPEPHEVRGGWRRGGARSALVLAPLAFVPVESLRTGTCPCAICHGRPLTRLRDAPELEVNAHNCTLLHRLHTRLLRSTHRPRWWHDLTP